MCDNKLKDINKRIYLMAEKKFPTRKIVYGYGSENAEIVLIGEAPGANEEKEGRPFVGKAGKNLTEFVASVGINRDSLYITNTVKIRPYKLSEKTGKPVNRPPNSEEKELFIPFLYDEIQVISPKLIVTLGNVPFRAILMNETINIGEYHGRVINFNGEWIFPLYHPAAVIYNQALKEIYNSDLEILRNYIDLGGKIYGK